MVPVGREVEDAEGVGEDEDPEYEQSQRINVRVKQTVDGNRLPSLRGSPWLADAGQPNQGRRLQVPILVQEDGTTKVGDLGDKAFLRIFKHQYVPGFEIAVDDAARMDSSQTLADIKAKASSRTGTQNHAAFLKLCQSAM